MLNHCNIFCIINSSVNFLYLWSNAVDTESCFKVNINRLAAYCKSKAVAVSYRRTEITDFCRHFACIVLFEIEGSSCIIRINLIPRMTKIIVLNYLFTALLKIFGNSKCVVIIITHAKCAVVHKHNCTAARVHLNTHFNLLAKGICCRHSVISTRNLVAQNALEFIIYISDFHTCDGNDCSRSLMSMNNKINCRMMTIRCCVNALFG